MRAGDATPRFADGDGVGDGAVGAVFAALALVAAITLRGSAAEAPTPEEQRA